MNSPLPIGRHFEEWRIVECAGSREQLCSLVKALGDNFACVIEAIRKIRYNRIYRLLLVITIGCPFCASLSKLKSVNIGWAGGKCIIDSFENIWRIQTPPWPWIGLLRITSHVHQSTCAPCRQATGTALPECVIPYR